MRISLCLIVKDEEEMLPRSLQAAAPAVDEIVVVDTGSTDSTVAIAESFGARVIQFPWNGSFADARNVSIEAATGDWILWLDADEVLGEGDAQRLRALARKPWREGFSLRFVNHLGEGEQEFVHRTMRLFRNRPTYRFHGRIHEQHTSSMPMHLAERFEETDVRVDHYGYRAERIHGRNKSERNLRLLRQIEAETGGNAFNDYNLGTEYLGAGDAVKACEVLARSWASSDTRRTPMPEYIPSLAVRVVQAHRLAGDPVSGLTLAEEAISLVPGHTDVVREAALCARATGDLERAAELAEACLELGDAPERYAGAVGAGTFLAQALLASIRAAQGRLGEAEDILVRTLAAFPAYDQGQAALDDVRAMRAVDALYLAAAALDASSLAAGLAAGSPPLPTVERHVFEQWHRSIVGEPCAVDIEAAPAISAYLDRLLREQAFDGFEALLRVWAAVSLPDREKTEIIATLYTAHGFLDSAAEEWCGVGDVESDSRALAGLARIAELRGDVVAAVEIAELALSVDPEAAAARQVIERTKGRPASTGVAAA